MFRKTRPPYQIIIVLLLVLNACSRPQPSNGHSPFKNGKYAILENKSGQRKAISVTPGIRVILDSLSRLKVMDSLYKGKRLLEIDGAAHFMISEAPQAVVIYTGMMQLTTRKVHFYINAYHESPGQSLKVFKGRLIATKSYTSDFPNTDTLEPGEMILINRDIDLMEKETFDTASKSTSP